MNKFHSTQIPEKLLKSLSEIITDRPIDILGIITDFIVKVEIRGDDSVLDEDLEFLRDKNITRLDLSHGHIKNITPLSTIYNLATLILYYTNTENIECLSGLELEELNLGFTNIVDVSPLSSMKSLQDLNLDSTNVIDLTPLSNLTNLKVLTLQATLVSDITPIANLTSLEIFDIMDTQVTDIHPLSNLVNMRVLNLSDLLIVNILPIQNMIKLEELYLDGTATNNMIVVCSIKKMSNLKILGIEDIEFSNKLLSKLHEKFPNTQINN